MEVEAGWVHLLEDRLTPNHQVVNASISGDTSAGGLARLPQSLQTHKPDIVILELGANDGLRGLSLAQMKQNLTDMINLSQTSGAEVILAAMQLPPNYGPYYTKKFRQIYNDLTSSHNVTLIPFLLENVGGVTELVQEDGLHPNAEAQPIILENVWRYLLPLLDTQVSVKDG